MISLRQINALPPVERDRCYLSVVPPALCERFGLDPLAFTDPQGKPVASEEESAMRAGLAPGQIRPGLQMLRPTLERIDAISPARRRRKHPGAELGHPRRHLVQALVAPRDVPSHRDWLGGVYGARRAVLTPPLLPGP